MEAHDHEAHKVYEVDKHQHGHGQQNLQLMIVKIAIKEAQDL